MLRGDAVGEVHGLVPVPDRDDGSEVAPGGSGDRMAAKCRQQPLHRIGDRVGEARVVGDQDRLGGFVMLGLAEQIQGHPFGVAGAVGQHQYLRGARDGIDPHPAEDLALGARHIGVARADDLVHRPDRPGAVGERGHGMGAADFPDLADSRQFRRCQHRVGHLASGGRHRHGDAPDPRDTGGDRVHQNRGGIGGLAPWYIESDPVQRDMPQPQGDTRFVCIGDILRTLPLVEGPDAARCGGQGLTQRNIDAFQRLVRFFRGNLQFRHPRRVDAIEPLRQFQKGGIAPLADILDDGGDSLRDIPPILALGGKNPAEVLLESGAGRIKSGGHRQPPESAAPRC